MPSLADAPELVGFFSYSRDDDEDSEGGLTNLRRRIQSELRGQLGRSRGALQLWQDLEAIPTGALWESQIEAAINQSVFFIPILTPRVVNSKYCADEFLRFEQREKALLREDLVFPIVYIEIPDLRDEDRWRRNLILRLIAKRQYVDWSDFRHDLDSVAVRRAIAAFCKTIVAALRRPTPEALIAKPAAPAARSRPAAVEAADAPAGEAASTSSRHVLIVDDEQEIRELIANYLIDQGYRVSVAGDGAEVRRAFDGPKIDLVLLDLGLTGEGGLDLAQWIRRSSDVPIIIVSGRSDPIDRVVLLEMGADDYLTKPFVLRELLARIRSVMRRGRAAEPIPAGPNSARFAGWSIDFAGRTLHSPAGELVHLTAGEFDLLQVFLANAGRALSRGRLMQLLGEDDPSPFSRTIEVRIGRLRRKLNDDTAPRMIDRLGTGEYIFVPAVELG